MLASVTRHVQRGRVKARPTDSFNYVQSVVNRLRIVKGGMTYSQMEECSGIHSTLLCRYVTGSTRPSLEQSELLERTLLRTTWFRDKLREKMTVTKGGYLDTHPVTSDPNALKWIAGEAVSRFSKIRCDRVLTAASSGISLATAIAMEMGTPIVHATQSKTAGTGRYLEADLHSRSPSEVSTLFLPGNQMNKGESVLIVDDVATSGRTLSGLITLVANADSDVSGIFVLASRSNAWKERISPMLPSDAKIVVLYELKGDA
jgi:adenine phosphoribosyltransferase